MNCPCYQLFASTRFTRDQNRGGRGADALDSLDDLCEARAMTNDTVEHLLRTRASKRVHH